MVVPYTVRLLCWAALNHAPVLFPASLHPDPYWNAWPRLQQRAVMEEYKRTGVLYRYPAPKIEE
jgi:hypothetical protein